MGMTIDELRNYVEEQRSLTNIPYHVYSTLIDELDLMAETMHKYQKIKRIIKAVDDRDIGYATMMNALHKVVEDGNER